MQATITSVRENPLLGRRRVEVEIEHEGEATPSEEDVKNRLAAENDLDTEKIEIESVKTGYGRNTSVGIVKVYEEFEYDEELEESPEEEQVAQEAEDTGSGDSSADYDDIVSGTITDAKDQLKEIEEADFEAALEAEKDNKDRKTLKEWLENQAEN